MAEIKYKFDYIEPENVESQVPEKQELRVWDFNSAIEKATESDENKVENPLNYILSPVLTVTKNEATFTKGDMKLQKVSVTENISKIRNGVFQTLKAPSYPPIHSEVIHDTPIRMDHSSLSENTTRVPQPIRRRTSLETNGQSEERRTRIPTRFQNAANRVRRERSMPAKKVNEALPTHPRRSSIPRLKPRAPSPKPEDEFERLFGDIANSPTDIDISLLNNKVDDPEKVEDCFEEIIHAYDENTIQPFTVETPKQSEEIKSQPITVEKPRQSKIPMLKRKSESEIDVPKSIQANNKTSSPLSNTNRFKDAVSKFTNDHKVPSRVAVTKRVNDESDNVKLKSSYQRERSISRDGKQHVLHVENIAKVSIEQDIGPDNAVSTESVEASETTESTIEIIEITPVVEKEDLVHEVSSQPYTVEIIESPTSTIIEEIQNDVLEIDETAEDEPKSGVFEAYNTINESKIQVGPVKVVSIDEFENLNRVYSKGIKNFKPVLDVNTNGTAVENNYNIESFARESFSIDKHIVNTPPSRVERTISDDDTDDVRKPQLRRSLRLNSKTETNEEDNPVQHRSILSKIAMFEQHRQDDNTRFGNRPKPAVRCSYRRRLLEEEFIECDTNTANPKICKDDIADDASEENKPDLPKSSIPGLPQRHAFIDTKPVIVSEVIKPLASNSFPNNETYNPVRTETIDYEVNNNVIKSNNLRISRMEIKTEQVAVSNAIEQNIIENHTVVSEVKENVINNNNASNERIKRHHPNRYYSFEVDYSQEKQENIAKVKETEIKTLTPVEIEYVEPLNSVLHESKSNDFEVQEAVVINQIIEKPRFDAIKDPKESPFDFTPKSKEYSSSNHKINHMMSTDEILKTYKAKNEDFHMRKAKSVAELDLGDAVKGKVQNILVRMKSVDKSVEKKEVISAKERPRKKSVMEKIAMFEGVLGQATALYIRNQDLRALQVRRNVQAETKSEEEYQALLEELKNAKETYGRISKMPKVTLSNGQEMPVLAVGTALLDPRLASNIIATAIDLGYRAIDSAFIYGNEKQIGEGIKKKIDDGTVKREDLFIIAKLWSTYHRRDLVEKAYKQTLENLGVGYVDLYLVHNPMSFKEGGDAIPKIANVVQYSEHDFLDAWYGMEDLVAKGLVKSIGLSNFNSSQVQKILDKAIVKPVVNQVECHPYLSQDRLYNFCEERNIKLSCFGVLGSKGTPPEHKSSTAAAIDDPMLQVMAAGLGVSPAQLLIRFQLQNDHAVVVKASSGAHMWDNLKALNFELSEAHMNAIRALNRNKRTFSFKGMGDTHKNYPFNAPF